MMEKVFSGNEQYFGGYMMANHVGSRRSVLDGIVKQEIDGKDTFNVLEIGSYAGSSAVVWAEAVQDKGYVVCVDPWVNTYTYDIPNAMREAYENNLVFTLFWHNMKRYSCIVPVRAKSDVVKLFGQVFNLVYIDGNHAYDWVTQDIVLSLNVLVDGGLLVGDDLELQFDQVDKDFAIKHRNTTDYIACPVKGRKYHPGVTCAVWDILGRVDTKSGIWAWRKQ